MMQGLDASYDAVLFIGYHGSMPSASVLSHTYNPRAVVRCPHRRHPRRRVRASTRWPPPGTACPSSLVTGDQFVGPEAEPFCPGIRAAVVKHSEPATPPTASTPSSRAGRSGGRQPRLSDPGTWSVPRVPGDLEVDLLTADMAETRPPCEASCACAERTVTIATATRWRRTALRRGHGDHPAPVVRVNSGCARPG